MKVKDLIVALQKCCEPDHDVVIQRSYDDGYFSHYHCVMQTDHPAHSGPVFHLSVPASETAKESYKEPNT